MGPFIRSKDTCNKMLIRLLISLIPLIIYSIYKNGMSFVLVLLISVLFTFVFDFIYSILFNKKYLKESYSVIPGILLSLVLPSSVPLYGLVIGLVALSFSKILLNKFDSNIINPVLIGYLVIFLLFTNLFNFQINSIIYFSLCVVAFLYLALTKTIKWMITISYVLVVFLINYVIGAYFDQTLYYPLFHVLNGSLLFSSIYLATDSKSSTVTPLGQILQGIFLGIITVFLRYIGIDGVVISLLIMNFLVPILDSIGSKSRFNIFKSLGVFLAAWIFIVVICLCFSLTRNVDTLPINDLNPDYIFRI